MHRYKSKRVAENDDDVMLNTFTTIFIKIRMPIENELTMLS